MLCQRKKNVENQGKQRNEVLEYSQYIRFYCSHEAGVIYFTQNILELKYSVGEINV